MQSKEEILREVFGNKPREIKVEYNPEVNHKSYASSQKQANGQTKIFEDKRNNYEFLAELIKNNHSNTNIRGLVTEWIEDKKTVLLCPISNEIANLLSDEIRYYMIPAILFPGDNQTIFIIRECDKQRFKRALSAIAFRYKTTSIALNLDTFNEFCIKDDIFPIFIKGMTRTEMECVRRENMATSVCSRYAIFELLDNKWGIGFDADDFLNEKADEFTNGCFAESYLKMLLLLNGKDSKKFKEQVDSDSNVDRLASLLFAPSLEEQDEVFVFNPRNIGKILRVTSGGFSILKISKVSEKWQVQKIKTYSFKDADSISIYNYELANMKHKKMGYNIKEIIDELKTEKKKKKKREQDIVIGKRMLAHNMLMIFIDKYKTERWFNNPNKNREKILYLNREIKYMLNAFLQKTVMLEYPEQASNVLFNIISEYSLNDDTFSAALKRCEQIDLAIEINEQEQNIGLSLNELVKSLEMQNNFYREGDYERM